MTAEITGTMPCKPLVSNELEKGLRLILVAPVHAELIFTPRAWRGA